jgi:YD repeat-containing protein
MDTVCVYDSLGRVDTVTQGNSTAKYSYNAQGLVEKVVDAAGRESTFTYNAAERFETSLFPGQRTVTFETDAVGNTRKLYTPGKNAHTRNSEYKPTRVSSAGHLLPWHHFHPYRSHPFPPGIKCTGIKCLAWS